MHSRGISRTFKLHRIPTYLNEILIFGDGDCLFNAVLIGFLIITDPPELWETIRVKYRFNIGEIKVVDDSNFGSYFKTEKSNTRLAIKNYACTEKDNIFSKSVAELNKLTYSDFDDIIGLGETEYGRSNEIKILSKLLEKDIIVIQPTNLLDENAAPITIFSKFKPDLTEETLEEDLINKLFFDRGDEYDNTIILHNTGYDVTGDNSSQHFNLLLTNRQRNKYKQGSRIMGRVLF